MKLRIPNRVLEDDRSTYAVNEHYQRHLITDRKLFNETSPSSFVSREMYPRSSAFNTIILSPDCHRTAIDITYAANKCRCERRTITGRGYNKSAEFHKTASIGKLGDPLPSGRTRVAMFSSNSFRPAARQRYFTPAFHFFEEDFPFWMRSK
ncbi:hypothetical protein D3C84_901820 [compost metagenome]